MNMKNISPLCYRNIMNRDEFFRMLDQKSNNEEDLIFIFDLHLSLPMYSSELYIKMIIKILNYSHSYNNIEAEILAIDDKEKNKKLSFVFHDGYRTFTIPYYSIKDWKEWNEDEALLNVWFEWMSNDYKNMILNII